MRVESPVIAILTFVFHVVNSFSKIKNSSEQIKKEKELISLNDNVAIVFPSSLKFVVGENNRAFNDQGINTGESF